MASSSAPNTEETRHSALAHLRREGERVTPLELFFDLVFVLAITQCTALMSHEHSWTGLAQGLLALGVVWWAWVGYSWLTSVIDPEAEPVRIVVFVAMAALLIVSLALPDAFGSLALVFALGIGVFRLAHIGLFMLAGAGDADLRRSVIGLAVSTAIAVALLAAASLFDGLAQGALWALAIVLDMGGPYVFGSEGWKLVPGHFAERHGLILIIALGESIVALGVGAAGHLTFGIGAAAVLGVGLAAALWWTYFDVVALISARRLGEAPEGRVRNELARDSYSYIHLALVAGIVLAAFGMKATIAHHNEELEGFTAFGLLGGIAIYLLGLVAFRLRQRGTINRHRLLIAIALLICVPVGTQLPALLSLAIVDVVIWAMIAYEHQHYGEERRELRREANESHSMTP
jgi:low temperature requirement protein LtrA